MFFLIKINKNIFLSLFMIRMTQKYMEIIVQMKDL